MRSGEVLSLIWQDGVTLPIHDGYRAFETMFSRILPVRAVCLLAGASCTRPLAMSDELELAPALPLGDVLVEELPVDLPYGTLVLFLPERDTDLSALMGAAVGEALQLLLNQAGLPMERETDALYLVAHAAMRRAAGLRAQGLQISPHLVSLWGASPLYPHVFFEMLRKVRGCGEGFCAISLLASRELSGKHNTLAIPVRAPYIEHCPSGSPISCPALNIWWLSRCIPQK